MNVSFVNFIEHQQKQNKNANLKGNPVKIYYAFVELINAIIGKENTTDDDSIVDAFLSATTDSGNLLINLANSIGKFVKEMPYRYLIARFDGAGGYSPMPLKTLDEVIDYMDKETFFDEENFGQNPCYDLVNKENISEKIYQYINAGRKRFALLGEDGDYQDETDTLEDAKTMAHKWVDGGISLIVSVYDREENEWVWYLDEDGEKDLTKEDN